MSEQTRPPSEETMSRRQNILFTVQDLVTDFIYYDRKEDSTLRPGAIEAAVKAGEISCDEIVNEFRLHLLRAIQP